MKMTFELIVLPPAGQADKVSIQPCQLFGLPKNQSGLLFRVKMRNHKLKTKKKRCESCAHGSTISISRKHKPNMTNPEKQLSVPGIVPNGFVRITFRKTV